MTPSSEHIAGYAAPIHRALWERILTLGAPRLWAALWLVGCLYTALIFLSDSHWDDMAIAQLTRRYKALYEAG